MSDRNVLALFGAPSRKSCLIAIANAIREVEYNERLTMAQIGAELDVDGETVENAKYERNLLNFVAIARLLATFPEHCSQIRNLWEMQPVDSPTPQTRLKAIIGEMATLEREIAA